MASDLYTAHTESFWETEKNGVAIHKPDFAITPVKNPQTRSRPKKTPQPFVFNIVYPRFPVTEP